MGGPVLNRTSMPYGRKGVKRYGGGRLRVRKGVPRRRYARTKKAFSKGAPSVVRIKEPSGMPDRLYVKLVVRTTISSVQASGALATASFVGNALFDTYTSGGGPQPKFFSNYSALYSRYVVYGSKIVVYNNLNNATSGPNNTITMISPTNESANFSSIDDQREYRYTRSKNMSVHYIGTGQSVNKGYYMSTAKIAGKPRRSIATEDDYSAPITANPQQIWHWKVSNYVPGASVTQSLVQDVKITYYACFYKPIQG